MHNGMLATVLHSPMSFFDTTPLGRIVNRFSKDTYTIDETIPATTRMFLNTLQQACIAWVPDHSHPTRCCRP
jgi:ABC-type multidrug transport system fused ATPase/permease subunit